VTPEASDARRQLALLSVAMLLGMSPWFSATAVAPALAARWGVSASTTAWLTMAVQLGFVGGTLLSALLMLPDRWSARRLAGGSALLAALMTALITLIPDTPVGAIALRLATGAALAGVYPPGMKLVAGWWRDRRGMAIGVLVGFLTIGSASPHLIRAVVPPGAWQFVLIGAALSSALAGILFLASVREGPYQAPPIPFDVRALRRIMSDRGVVLATGGYLGHMWELYAMWSSIGIFWAAVIGRRMLDQALAPALAFATIATGIVGCVVAGVYADRVGRARVTIIAMAVSAACSLGIGLLLDAPLPVLATVAIVWGIAIIADSAQFSACITELAPREYVGTALTLQTCLGFLLTMITIRMVPVWVEQWGWERAYAPLAIGPVLGILAMWRLGSLGRMRAIERHVSHGRQ
jgi:MFS family permease